MPDPNSNDQTGNAILSKYPILARDHLLLPRVGDNVQRALLKSVVDIGGKFVAFWSTHLDFHSDETERLKSVAKLNTWVSEETLPVVMGGDFNDTPGSEPCTRLRERWEDVWLLAGDGTLGRTAPCPPPLNVRIDYLWKAKSANLIPRNAFVGYTLEASDHYPVISQFKMTDFGTYAPGFCFRFDEGTGAKAADEVSGLSGTIGSGTPVWSGSSPTGIPGDTSLHFDGTRLLSIPDPKPLISTNGLNDDYTLQAWVKVAMNYVPPQRATLFQYERRPGFSFSINTNRTLHTTTFKIKDISSAATLPNDGAWHHVAVVHTDGGTMRFYIDGGLASTVSYKNGAGQRTSSVITMGADAEGANPFTGYLDRVRFDNRALTPAEFDLARMPQLQVARLGVGGLLLYGAGGIPGASYRLLSATNAGAPAGQWLPMHSGVFGSGGQFSNAVPVQGNATLFYKIAVP